MVDGVNPAQRDRDDLCPGRDQGALEILGDAATKPLVVRLDGNNVEAGRAILCPEVGPEESDQVIDAIAVVQIRVAARAIMGLARTGSSAAPPVADVPAQPQQ